MNWRADLSYLPEMIRSRVGGLVVTLVGLGTGLFLLVRPLGSSDAVNTLFQLLVLPPAIGAVIVAAIAARRARYLAGAFGAFVGAVGFGIAVFTTPDAGTGTPIPVHDQVTAVLQSVIVGALFGAAIGAIGDGIAWALRGMLPGRTGTELAQLAQLGELRDRGVISPAEFEAKKSDLLRRA